MKVFDVACFLVHAVHAAVWSRTTLQRLYRQLLGVIVEDHYPWSVVFCFFAGDSLVVPSFLTRYSLFNLVKLNIPCGQWRYFTWLIFWRFLLPPFFCHALHIN